MRRVFSAVAIAMLLAACGLSERSAAHNDPQLDALFVQLAQAPDTASAMPIQEAIMAHWADSGSATVNILIERADAAIEAGDADMAVGFLEQASDLAPDYAEPWKRRANIAYRAEDYAGAISALNEMLRREPRHFEAMAALGAIYEEIGEERAAIEAYRAALSRHPYYQPALEGVRRLEPRVEGRDA